MLIAQGPAGRIASRRPDLLGDAETLGRTQDRVGEAGPRSPSQAYGPSKGVDQATLAQIVQDKPPVGACEAIDDHAAVGPHPE